MTNGPGKVRPCCIGGRNLGAWEYMKTVFGKNPYLYSLCPEYSHGQEPDRYSIERAPADREGLKDSNLIESMCTRGHWFPKYQHYRNSSTYIFRSARVGDEYVRRLNHGVPKAPELIAGMLGIAIIGIELTHLIVELVSNCDC